MLSATLRFAELAEELYSAAHQRGLCAAPPPHTHTHAPFFFSQEMMHNYFCEEKFVNDPEVLLAAAAKAGLPESKAVLDDKQVCATTSTSAEVILV